MGLYIPGMKMPTNCDVCPFDNKLYCVAYAPSKDMIYDISDGRPDWCPLIEVQPHGRLIDADAFKSFVQNDWENNLLSNGDWIMLREYLKVAPTIIPVEEGE